MVLFALSCFGLLLFLWLSLRRPRAAQAQGLRVQGRVPRGGAARPRGRRPRRRRERSARCGRRTIDPRHRNRTIATIEVDPSYAPIAKDARAILRQKTLLGETYVELTPGHASAAGTIPDGGHARRRAGEGDGRSSTRSSRRSTRGRGAAFQGWQQELAKAITRPQPGPQRRARQRCPRSPTTAPTCCGSSTARSSRRRRSSATPASCSAR